MKSMVYTALLVVGVIAIAGGIHDESLLWVAAGSAVLGILEGIR